MPLLKAAGLIFVVFLIISSGVKSLENPFIAFDKIGTVHAQYETGGDIGGGEGESGGGETGGGELGGGGTENSGVNSGDGNFGDGIASYGSYTPSDDNARNQTPDCIGICDAGMNRPFIQITNFEI